MKILARPFEIKSVTEEGVFEGYGNTFGVVDAYNEIVAPGAFSDSLTDWRGKNEMPAMLWQHDPREPIGVYTAMREDDKGLYVQGQLALKVSRGAEAYELLKMGAIKRMSIGFMVREDSYDQKTGIATIKKLDLWEVSLVTFAANEGATVDSVKTIPEFESVSDVERFLRDVGSYSKLEARTFTSKVIALARRDAVAREADSVRANAAIRLAEIINS